MTCLVREMNQVGATRFYCLHNCNGLREAQVRRVAALSQRVQHHHVQIAEQVERRIRDLLSVRDVGQITKSKAGDRQAPVQYRNRDNLLPEELEGTIDLAQEQ